MKKTILKLLILILTLLWGFNLQSFAAGEIRYIRREIKKENLRKDQSKNDSLAEPADIVVKFNHGKIISSNGVISQSTFKLSGVYPSSKMVNQTNDFPGNRGPGQLVVYLPEWGLRTGTNEFGKEAVIINSTVVKITGADSVIPQNGYILSGHGAAKTWMNNNIKVGTKINVDEANSRLTAYTTVDSYRYQASAKINELEEMLDMAKNPNFSSITSDKKIKAYIKKAKQFLKKADSDDSEGLAYALASIEASNYALSFAVPYIDNELHGIWVRPSEKSASEVAKTFDALNDAGINAVFVETFYHGKTIYPSMVMKKYGFSVQNSNFVGFDPLSAYIAEAKKRNMQLHVWFESFYIGNNPPSTDFYSILTVRPMWGNKYKAQADAIGPVSHPTEHRGYFLDPANPEVVIFLNELILEIASRYDVTGINVDYVRYPQAQKPNASGYEASNWGYTEYARNEFKAQYGIDPFEVGYGAPLWKKWDLYRQNKIANYVSIVKNSLKDRGVVLSVVVFPDEESCIATKQQDWGKWTEIGLVDAITPLILTSDAELAQNTMHNIKRKAGKAKIYPGIFVGFMDGEAEDMLRQIRAVRLEQLDGVILFDYAHFDKRYVDALKNCTFSAICR